MTHGELQQIGPYTITRLLGTSSTSSHYQGKQSPRKKEVLIKVFHTPLPGRAAKEAFVARTKQLKKLKHRQIVEVQDMGFIASLDANAATDVGAQDDYGYLVMQYITGEPLRSRLSAAEYRFPDAVQRVLSPSADALHYAHMSTIVHGNLHPGALLIGERNNTLLTDFSYRLLLPDAADSVPLLLDDEEPALLYMAPEALRGSPSPASDQYALAVIVYELLCESRPYAATDRESLLHQQEQQQFAPPRSLNEHISPAVEKVLLQALASSPEERFLHIQAFADAYLHALMGLPIKESQRTHVAVPSSPLILPVAPGLPTPMLHVDTKQADSVESEGAMESVQPSKMRTLPLAAEPLLTHVVAQVRPTHVHQQGDQEQGEAKGKERDWFDEEAPLVFPLPNDEPLYESVSADLRQGGILSESLPGYEERPPQIEMASLVARSLTESVPAIVEAGTGTGKALDVETPIPTPIGWKRMGDLVVGDVVFDESGSPTPVIAAFDVMYDRTCYEVEFSDGSSIVADAEHEWASYTVVDRKWVARPRTGTYAAKNFVTSDQLGKLEQVITLSQSDNPLSVSEAVVLIGGHHWSVYQAACKIAPVHVGKRPTRYPRQVLLTSVRERLERDLSTQRRDSRAYTLVTTESMAATLTVGASQRANHAVSVAGPLVLPEADVPIAPYFLGVWLGDGSCRSNQITTADPILATEIEKDGYSVRSLKSHPYLYAVDDENGKAVSRWQPGMTGRLRALGILRNKHIPPVYLRASVQQRRALLAGLLDTDGTVGSHGAVEFTTTNPRLAQDVHELMCSLGFRPWLGCGRSRYNGKDCGPKWTLAFTTDEQVFRLERKVTAHKERLRNYSPERNRFRYVVAVREVPSRPVRCIQVESQSHLYLAGRSMIPTHNSLAYLLPIVRSGKVAIISTANKALQEQLFYKDIPFVQKHIKPFDAALVKGIGNYVCLDRLENERTGMQFYAKNREFIRLTEITAPDADSTFTGDFETLDFQLPGDIRSRVCGDSDQCAWSKCDYFDECYVRKMRAKAEMAQVIVVNHTLLLIDAAMDGFLLPARDIIVLDEAHHLEEEATRSFTITISPSRITSLLNQRLLKDHSKVELQDQASTELLKAWGSLEQLAELEYKGRVNLQAPLPEGLRLATLIADLADSLRLLRPKDLAEKESQLYDKLVKRTQNLAEDIRLVFSVAQSDKFVYYVERANTPGQRGFQVQVSAAPLDITTWLQKHLFDKCNVICTSATLATIGPNPAKPEEKGPNFAYFRSRVGLAPADRPNILECILPLSFDYESNALLYLPRDLPAPVYGSGPEAEEYARSIAREMYRLVKASRGRAFLLFSSKRMLEQSYDLMAPHLDEFPLLRQGDMSRIELTRRFKTEEGAVLFGLKSFWEGVDIPGEALSMVVIDKLPFDPPDDPVHEARIAQMKKAGENWFGIYVLPQAVLRLKQGLGRLLRTSDDRGVMAILDTRLHTKGYGKQVLSALPPARRTSSMRDVERFFAQ